MQSANVQFVTFDARDVITTSSTVVTTWFTPSGMVANQKKPLGDFGCYEFEGVGNDPEIWFINPLINGVAADCSSLDTVFVLPDERSSSNVNYWDVDLAINVTVADSAPKGGKQLTTYTDILNWITAHSAN